MRILSIDVGMGTQDIFLYDDGLSIENCVKMVLPSRTMIVAKQIRSATEQRLDICLTGDIMGGGPSTKALKEHLKAGLKAYATPQAALTFNDNLDRIREWGVQITDEAKPENAARIITNDIDLEALQNTLSYYDVEMPDNIAVAVQDHGEAADQSNRIFRFQHFKQNIEQGGDLNQLAYKNDDIPPHLTRMKSVRNSLKKYNTLLMDTSTAAIKGALINVDRDKTTIVLNIGNGHTMGALLMDGMITGLFEHHTRLITPAKLEELIRKMGDGTLVFEEVFDDMGHGAHIKEAPGFNSIEQIIATGPNRNLAQQMDLEVEIAAPHGDPMITGCMGLIEAYKLLSDR